MVNTQNPTRPKKDHLSRSFDWLNATQFLGALNDNVFRWLMVFFLIGILGKEKDALVTSTVGAVFVIPFLLLTPLAGILADRFSKRSIIVLAKIAELIIMVLGWAVFSFGTQLGNPVAIGGIYLVLFLMCTQSSFFGPCKYGIIPELVDRDQISKANSFLEGLTYLSIVIGTAFAPWLADTLDKNFMLASISCVVFAAAGILTSLKITKTQPMSSGENIHEQFSLSKFLQIVKSIQADRYLLMTVLASAYFMLLAGFAQINMIPYGREVCNYDDVHSGYLFLVAAVGIGLGSWLAGKLSGRSVEFGIVPIGALGMALASIILGIMPQFGGQGNAGKTMIFTMVFIFGVSCGLFIVPIHAFIQIRAPEKIRARVIAVSSFLGWIGVLAASGLLGLCCGLLKIKPSTMFLGLGVLTLALAAGTLIVLPDFLLRLVIVLLTRTLYRIRTHGLENVPAEGPALLISNHVSWADPVILLATQQRRIRFLMDRTVFSSKWFGWLFRLARVIPIKSDDSPKKIMTALEQARAAMDEGSLVCIFAEGTITRTGMLGRFRAGFEKVAQGTDYQIIPTYLGGVWGSLLSHYYGRLLSAWPKKIPYPVSVHFGRPLPADTSVEDIRLAIEELSCDYFDEKKANRLSLGQTFIRAARKNWGRPFISDTTGKRLTWGNTLTAAAALSKKLEEMTAGQKNIGILLPPSAGAACTNLAIALLNKTAVNLSYTASESDRQYMLEQAEVKTILTSRAFLEKLGLGPEALPGAVFMEDLMGHLTGAEKARAWLRAFFTPGRRLAHAHDFKADDTAVILFSSGSSGRPKGVLLSHHNILSNLEAALMVFRVQPNDKLCAILPFFHSFGLTCTLWLPILAEVPACFVPNPLDGKLVGETIRTEQATLLFATPTFLLNYLRRCEAEDFKTVRFMIAGAEKLKVKMIDSFEKKFGIRPREGYGATECSPLIAINVLDAEVGGVKQVGTKEGTAGHPLPGIAVRILDPETGQPVSMGQAGLLWIKGPNIMKGYLNLPEKTSQVLQDGWYNTGDIVTLDRDGFITITDRLSRFSKIGGEMVPHMTIEETCMMLLGQSEPAVAVTSLPDEKKGEQLVLIYAKDKVDPDQLYEKLAESDLPKLYIPKRDNLIGVDEIPHLGSGKLDFMTLRKIAAEYKEKKDAE